MGRNVSFLWRIC